MPVWRSLRACRVLLLISSSWLILLAQSGTNHAQQVLSQGEQLLRSGQPAAAKELLDAAVKAAPRSAEALTWRGICSNELKEYAAAEADFRRAIALDKSSVAAHYNLALSLIRLGKIDAAIEQLEWVTAGQPQATQPNYNLAVLLEAKGAYAESVRRLSQVHSQQPEDKEVTLHLLVDSLKAGQVEALSTLVSEIEDTATPAAIQLAAGSALLDAGRCGDAELLLRAANGRAPDLPHGSTLLAEAMLRCGEAAAALKVLEDQSTHADDEAEKLYLLGLAYVSTAQITKASASFEALAKLAPNDARPLYQLGLLAELMPDGHAKALALLQAAHAMQPNQPTYSLAFARILLVEDRADEALDLLQGISVGPRDSAQRSTLLGVSMAAKHKFQEAIPVLEKALEDDPKSSLANRVLGVCLMQQGLYAPAAEAYGRASALEPTRALYALDAAHAYDRAGMREQSLHFAERARVLDDNDAEDHALLGKLYAAGGQRNRAIEELRRSVTLNPELDSAYYLLARTYQQMGDLQQAKEWSEKLAAVKQEHEADFLSRKKEAASTIRSSTLLEGGTYAAQPNPIP